MDDLVENPFSFNMTPERVQAMDNLLELFGFQRRPEIFGGGIVVYHKSAPSRGTWLSCTESEEEWARQIAHAASA